MLKETRIAFNKYAAQVAKLNGIPDATEKFAVEPGVQQTLETKIQESSEFLNRINVIGVKEKNGAKLGLGISGPSAGRTDTTTKTRQTRDLSTLDENGYNCVQTNFDTHIRYEKLDAWAKFPDFQTRIRDLIIRRQALDRIMIGFNGTSAAADTDITANPLLQDVNKGWLQHYRENADERVMTGGKTDSEIQIGTGGDYNNLDALVFDLINTMVDPWYRDDPNLVVLLGRGLLADKYFPLVNTNNPPTEMMAADIVISQKRVGGRQAVSVPYFQENAVLVTTFDNLSLYWQESARRRHLKDVPERDRIENYESSNDAYVVEDYGRGAMAENIVLI
ncbi:phage major capsid protein, P2 family [Oxalobacter paraformigenes]|uniref:P2 family phage major capsid protein n=1 Tax=Oxalobacter paraformigenes TaxID=556268 RepID=C3X1Z8_9BURK|nr:phage major capsid protein, P2 family [Oxalobacter paraformigenes]EEO27234.1 P2 family phage major capsid protein [Oxalobacter paraformigenes]